MGLVVLAFVDGDDVLVDELMDFSLGQFPAQDSIFDVVNDVLPSETKLGIVMVEQVF